MHVTVVIPSYNRGPKLKATLERLLASDIAGIDGVEIIVVDDGSPSPLEPVVSACPAHPPFSLRCIRQSNAGPAAARNTGFRSGRGDIVLFVDDDILCPPDLVRRHVDAHRENPDCVIFGACHVLEPPDTSPIARYVHGLAYSGSVESGERYIRVDAVASGHLSVERRLFDNTEGVYRDDLATPAAEEYELSLRMRDRGIPILVATEIVALHDHPVDLGNMCRQSYKYGVGAAEVSLKYERAATLPALRNILRVNGPVQAGDSVGNVVKKGAKRVLAASPARKVLGALIPRRRTPNAQQCGVVAPVPQRVGPESFRRLPRRIAPLPSCGHAGPFSAAAGGVPMILVLGAGFIGRALAETLASLGHSVRIFSRRPIEERFAHECIVGDLEQIHRFPRLFDGVETVIHCIHGSVPANSNANLIAEVDASLLPTLKLVEAMKAHDVRSLIYLSSGGAVYGRPERMPVSENSPTLPISGYGVTKLAIEQYLRLHSLQGNLDRLVILRPANIYGPGQPLGKPQGVVGHLIHAAMTGSTFTVWGDGSACKDYLHIEDFCRAVGRAIETPEVKHAVLNVSSGNAIALREVIQSIEAFSGKPISLRFGPPHPGDVLTISLDNRLARRLLGWEPLISFAEGIEQTVQAHSAAATLHPVSSIES